MLTTVAIIALIILVGAEGFLAWKMCIRAWDAEKELAGAWASLKGSHSAFQRFNDLFSEKEKEVRLLTSQKMEMVDRLDEVRRLSRAQYEAREAKLLAQIQTLSDRLSQLRLRVVNEEGVHFAVESGGDDPFFADETIPYSADLHDFVKQIESEDARQLVEDYIEERRANHEDDAQILTKLQRGEY
jgi:hypothetical protein